MSTWYGWSSSLFGSLRASVVWNTDFQARFDSALDHCGVFDVGTGTAGRDESLVPFS